MPLPKPKRGEDKATFHSRCMSNEAMMDEYPETKQRNAVCYSLWQDQQQNREVIAHLNHNMSNLVTYKEMDGKQYLVAPSVLIVEGVLNGSFYPADEIATCPEAWNGRPVLIEHSVDESGRPKTGNDPVERENRTVGWLFNVHYENKKLKAEVWIDPEKCKHVKQGLDVLSKLENNQPIEVSTGVFTYDVECEGKFNEVPYNFISTDLRGDHLALLPNGTGACSWDDGAGLPRINTQEGDNMETDSNTHVESFDEEKTKWSEFLNKAKDFLGFSTNEVGVNGIYTSINEQLSETYDKPEMEQYSLIEEILPNSSRIIFRVSRHGESTLYQQNYEIDERTVSVTGEPKEVEMETSYVPKDNSENPKENNDMDRDKMIQELVENCDQYEETDSEVLKTLSDDMLQKVYDSATLVEAEDDVTVENEEEETETQEVRFNSEEELFDALPEGRLKDTLRASMKLHNEQRSNLIKNLKDNDRCDYTEDELNEMSLDSLVKLGKLARVPNFIGNTGAPKPRPKRKGAPAMPRWNWKDDKLDTDEDDNDE